MNEPAMPDKFAETARPAVRFGFSISPGEVRGVGAEVAVAERLGYSRVGIWDSPALYRDPYVALAAVAQATSRISLGTWVTNPLTRHPVVTASAAASIDDLAPGRSYIGIGIGGTGVMHLGYKAARIQHLEEYCLALRSLFADGRATYQGSAIRLEWAAGRRIPLILAAHGPASLRLAGRIADGVVIALGVTPEVIQGCLALVQEGARQAGRSLADLAIWFTCFWFVNPLPGVAQEQGAWAATSFASHFHAADVDSKFVPPEYQAGLVELGRAYDYVTHGSVTAEQRRAYAGLAERLGIKEYLQRRFSFSGTPDEVEVQIRAAVQAGAANFDGAIDALLPEHIERITQWANLVLPRFDPLP